ncbi:hypothetical protein JCM16303_001681 [Sporobolomyces ruberrimus]
MVVWLLKLLIVSLNIRSSHKALNRRTTRASGSSSGAVPRKKRLKGEVTNWVVWVAYLMVERLADRLVGWVPLYGTFKAFFLVMFLLSRGAGSRIIFDKLIKPTVKPWEGTLDFVGFVLSEVIEITLYCLLLAPRWAAKTWRGPSEEPDIPSILRGLRQQEPPSRVARSLAQTIERTQQGNSDRINERLSQPVTIRLNPVQATNLRRPPPPPAASVPTLVPKPLLAHPGPPPSLPPAAFSTAPFRPIKPTSSARPLSSTTGPTQSFRPVASTSRLPVASSRQSTSAGSSIYPSLESLPPAPTASFSPMAPSPKQALQRSSLTSSESTAAKAVSSPPNTMDSTPPKRRSTRKSRSKDEPTAEAASPPRSPEISARLPVVPPTPAPPGAFNLSTPPALPRPESPTKAAGETMQIDDDTEDPPVVIESKTPTPRKKSTRKEEKHKRSIRNVDEGESEVDTPKKKKIKSSPAIDRNSVQSSKARGKGKEKAKEPESEVVGTIEDQGEKISATPRQRALGAILKLATDLMDEDDGESLTGLSSAKKGKGKSGGVLARSSSTTLGRTKRGTTAASATRSRRGASKEHDEDDGDFVEEEVRPKKKRVARAQSNSEEAQDSGENQSSKSKPPRKTVVAGSKAPTRSRTSRTTASSSTMSRRTTVESRTSSSAPSPVAIEQDQSAGPVAPKCKARRVLRRADAAAELEDEVEIEGVAVVAGRRRR